MAKRKRLSPPDPQTVEHRMVGQGAATGFGNVRRSNPPIADVARDSATQAALETISAELESARNEGRLIQSVPLAAIKTDHLVRDRLALDEAEMEALIHSLKNRGQQTPIEVVRLEDGQYGLISGWRRMEALRRIGAGEALAIVRAPTGSADAYLAMIEENEVRAGLSYYERARLAAEAARIGIYRDAASAVKALYASASAPKRSKINSFVSVHTHLGGVLKFPAEIPERLGLALAAVLEKDREFGSRLRDALRKTPPQTSGAERGALERSLRKVSEGAMSRPQRQKVAKDLFLETGKGRAVLSGPALDQQLLNDLRTWLATR